MTIRHGGVESRLREELKAQRGKLGKVAIDVLAILGSEPPGEEQKT